VTETPPEPSRPDSELHPLRVLMDEVAAALAAGKAPRARLQLQAAVRKFKEAGSMAEAATAQGLIARLELSRGRETNALRAARAALRLSRPEGGPSLDESLSLLGRLMSRGSQHDQARQHGQEWLLAARRRGDLTSVLKAQQFLAVVEWRAGSPARALARADAAREESTPHAGTRLRSERLLATLLIRAGCPTAASKQLSRLLKDADAAEEALLLVARGWAWRCLGSFDRAARDFRRAQRLLAERGEPVREVWATAALAAVEARRARETRDEARQARATALAQRVARRAARLRHPDLPSLIESLERDMGGDAGADLPLDRKAAARALVELGEAIDSIATVDACVMEVERLNALPEGTPAYHCSLLAALPLE
jgi:tetratricopeptide (TPR) repeat protein